ncbi:VOC family protein [Aequorivita sp. KMM 9714]|uniref:VOC family protein n=1 Tax=Aequorivita sp. KMM 9714 TaxID=2707173 RepID=UPI0013EC8231|nr:VOC family protein [Aequorivita sp. KMM 9714]NGX84315.1 VOC family protein [Aequorivita sp. KMM 9714]
MKRLILLLALTFSSLNASAQSFELKHDHSTIQVENIDISAKFYKNILNLRELDTPWPEYKLIRFFDTGTNQQLHIAQAQVDKYGDIKINKVLHLAFAVNNFDGFLEHLKEKGIEYSNFAGESEKIQSRPDGIRQIYFQDPDGYWIEINDAKH